jgi:Transposase DDE domain
MSRIDAPERPGAVVAEVEDVAELLARLQLARDLQLGVILPDELGREVVIREADPTAVGELELVRQAQFRRSGCGACPLRARCLGPRETGKTLQIEPHEDLLIAARQALEHPPNAEHLRRDRPRIERLISLLAHRYGARTARYVGAAKARLQGLWAAGLVNLNPIARHLVTAAA